MILKKITNIDNILGVLFSLGALIDESLGQHDGNNYLSERNCSHARSLIVLKWTVIGFLMKTDYEDPIDSIDDVLKSNRQFMFAADTTMKRYVEDDPREKMQALAKRAKHYNMGTQVGMRNIAIE